MSKQRFDLYRIFFWGFIIFLEAFLIGSTKQVAPSGNGSPSVKDLLDELNKGDFLAKLRALDELRKLGADAKPAVPALIKILEDDKTPIPGSAAAVELKRIERPAHANPILRSSAAAALGEIGPDAKHAIPVLLATLRAKSPLLRMNSAKALADIDVKEDRILSALKETLDDPNTDVRICTAKALSELDPKSKDAICTLIKLLKDKDHKQRFFSAYALAEIRSSIINTAIPDLLIALHDPNEDVREITSQSLGSICEESAKVVPALMERLEKDESSKVRIQAAQGLQEYGPEARSAIPALNRAMKDDPDADVRRFAAQAIRRINIMRARRGRKGAEEEFLQRNAENPELKKEIEKLRRRRARDKR